MKTRTFILPFGYEHVNDVREKNCRVIYPDRSAVSIYLGLLYVKSVMVDETTAFR